MSSFISILVTRLYVAAICWYVSSFACTILSLTVLIFNLYSIIYFALKYYYCLSFEIIQTYTYTVQLDFIYFDSYYKDYEDE